MSSTGRVRIKVDSATFNEAVRKVFVTFNSSGKELAKTNVLFSQSKDKVKEVQWNEVFEFEVDTSKEMEVEVNFSRKSVKDSFVIAIPSQLLVGMVKAEEKSLPLTFPIGKLQIIITPIDFGVQVKSPDKKKKPVAHDSTKLPPMPSEQEVELRFKDIMRNMNLTPEMVKGWDLQTKWKLVSQAKKAERQEGEEDKPEYWIEKLKEDRENLKKCNILFWF